MQGYAHRAPCAPGKTAFLPTFILNPHTASPLGFSAVTCHHSTALYPHTSLLGTLFSDTLGPNPISEPQRFHLQQTSRIGHFLPFVPILLCSKLFLLPGLLLLNASPCLPKLSCSLLSTHQPELPCSPASTPPQVFHLTWGESLQALYSLALLPLWYPLFMLPLGLCTALPSPWTPFQKCWHSSL